jgi:hypothetical protein
MAYLARGGGRGLQHHHQALGRGGHEQHQQPASTAWE